MFGVRGEESARRAIVDSKMLFSFSVPCWDSLITTGFMQAAGDAPVSRRHFDDSMRARRLFVLAEEDFEMLHSRDIAACGRKNLSLILYSQHRTLY
jgi:hypothetical protein